MESQRNCIGLYCGRTVDETGNYSDCGACPRGYTVNPQSVCVKCTASPLFYDWLYLSFIPLLSLGLHCFFIEFTNRRKINRLLILHISALIETVAASLFTLLVMEPKGTLSLTSCPVRQLSDWYTLFYNPKPDYINEMHCTQEAVYPLYTVGFVYCVFALGLMVLFRPALSQHLVMGRGTKSIYAALYFFPILVCVHTLLAGFVYYSYAYVVLVTSVITSAIHLSRLRQQSFLSLVKSHVTDGRNAVILACHWFLHAFGIIAVTQLRDPGFHGSLVCLVPVPALFYMLTVRFSDPLRLDVV